MKRKPRKQPPNRPPTHPEGRKGVDPGGDPWLRGLDWGPLSPSADPSTLREELGDDPWSVSMLRRAVEGEAESLGLDVDGLFQKVQAAVGRLASSGELTAKDAEDVGMLLLIVTCRDPMLPETGRRHAMGLVSAAELWTRRAPQCPTAAEMVGAMWTALRSLGGTGVVDTSAWTPGNVVFDGEQVKAGGYRPLVMTPGNVVSGFN